MKSFIHIALSSALVLTGSPLVGSVGLPGMSELGAAVAASRGGAKPPSIKPKFNHAAKPKPSIKPKFNQAAKPRPSIKPKFNQAAKPKPTIKPKFNRAARGSLTSTFNRAGRGGSVVTTPKGPKVPSRVKPTRRIDPKTPPRVQPYGKKKPLRDTFNDKANPKPKPTRKDQNTKRHDLPGPTFPNPGF